MGIGQKSSLSFHCGEDDARIGTDFISGTIKSTLNSAVYILLMCFILKKKTFCQELLLASSDMCTILQFITIHQFLIESIIIDVCYCGIKCGIKWQLRSN